MFPRLPVYRHELRLGLWRYRHEVEDQERDTVCPWVKFHRLNVTILSSGSDAECPILECNHSPHEELAPARVFGRSLLRIWDHYSGSKPRDGCMTCREPCQRLDAYKSRKESLTIHINRKDWRSMPCISLSTSNGRRS